MLIFEGQALAQVALDHYLARTGEPPSSYGLLPFTPAELLAVLEGRPEGGGFDRAALNPIISRHFPRAVSYSAGWSTEEFAADLKDLSRTNRG